MKHTLLISQYAIISSH